MTQVTCDMAMRAVAGERGVAIAGGAATINQYLAAGLIDELRLHVVPILLGAGERLLEGRRTHNSNCSASHAAPLSSHTCDTAPFAERDGHGYSAFRLRSLHSQSVRFGGTLPMGRAGPNL